MQADPVTGIHSYLEARPFPAAASAPAMGSPALVSPGAAGLI